MAYLARRSANFAPLTPLTFLARASQVFPTYPAIVYDDWKSRLGDTETPAAVTQSYSETATRVTQLASALAGAGIQRGDTVAVLSPNTPAFIEAHHAVNAAGAALNPLNVRVDKSTLAYVLEHCEAKVVLSDTAYAGVMRGALDELSASRTRSTPLPIVIDIVDPIEVHAAGGEQIGDTTYEALLASGSSSFEWRLPEDEWETQAINYTSGTTGRPKGVLYHHRGAALNAMNNAVVWGMQLHPTYLWTLPLFHCNGWCFPYTITMQAGVHVCLRSIDTTSIFSAIGSQQVSHMCGAPVIMNMMLHGTPDEHAPLHERAASGSEPVRMFTAGAPPPPAVIEGMEALGMDITHAVSCPWQSQWDTLPAVERAAIKARQGVKYPLLEEMRVARLDDDTLDVPSDGETMGEIRMRGNVVMKGYLKNEAATEAAFEGGWFRSGDLAVVHDTGYIEIKDRMKDIIISGGENISTVEVEGALYRHPGILEAAVVARPHAHWGEVPCAFVVLKEGAEWGAADNDEAAIIEHCRTELAHFKAPKHVICTEGLPKTSTGKVMKHELRERARVMAAEAIDGSAS